MAMWTDWFLTRVEGFLRRTGVKAIRAAVDRRSEAGAGSAAGTLGESEDGRLGFRLHGSSQPGLSGASLRQTEAGIGIAQGG